MNNIYDKAFAALEVSKEDWSLQDAYAALKVLGLRPIWCLDDKLKKAPEKKDSADFKYLGCFKDFTELEQFQGPYHFWKRPDGQFIRATTRGEEEVADLGFRIPSENCFTDYTYATFTEKLKPHIEAERFTREKLETSLNLCLQCLSYEEQIDYLRRKIDRLQAAEQKRLFEEWQKKLDEY